LGHDVSCERSACKLEKKVNSEPLLKTPLSENPEIILDKPMDIWQVEEVPQCI